MTNRVIIGHIENIDLPEFGIKQLTVRVDSGAKTSSLHVENLEKVTLNHKPGVAFTLLPEFHNVDTVCRCEAMLQDIRKIKSSNGATEQRYVVKTLAVLGDLEWEIELTLTDRSSMTYMMLLGREAMGELFYIDAAHAFVATSK